MHLSRFHFSIGLSLPGRHRSLWLGLLRTIAAVFLVLSLLVFTGCVGISAPRKQPAVGWWKGNLHTHTLWSDGRGYPEMVVEWYKNRGYHFLVLSDHNILSQGQKWIDADDNRAGPEALGKYLDRFGESWIEQRTVDGKREVRLKPLGEFRSLFEEPGRFLMIQGEEITDAKAHLNGINLLEVIPPQGGDTVLEVLQNNVDAVLAQRRRTGQAMFPHINHPNFRWDLTAEDIMQVRGEKFFEVHNGHPGVRNYGDHFHVGTERMWDIILTKRLAELSLPIMYGVATDDAHHYHKWGPKSANPGRGWVVVRAHLLTPESIIKSMEAGDFYASTGVALKDVQFDGTTLEIVMMPERGVSYTTEFIGTLKGYRAVSKPVVDENGVEIRTTRIYSDDIGQVLARVTGIAANYTLTGNELYVRARVISTKVKDNPFAAGDFEVAWVQPVVPERK
jgi:hypothetical protein